MIKKIFALLVLSFITAAFANVDESQFMVLNLYKNGTNEEIGKCISENCMARITNEEFSAIKNYKMFKEFESLIPLGKNLNSEFERIYKFDKLLRTHEKSLKNTWFSYLGNNVEIFFSIILVLLVGIIGKQMTKRFAPSVKTSLILIMSIVGSSLGGTLVLIANIFVLSIFSLYLHFRNFSKITNFYFFERSGLKGVQSRYLRSYLPLSLLLFSMIRIDYLQRNLFSLNEEGQCGYVPLFVAETLILWSILQLITVYVSRLETQQITQKKLDLMEKI